MGLGDLRGKCLFLSILVVLYCGEDHSYILILEPEICLPEVCIGHLFVCILVI